MEYSQKSSSVITLKREDAFVSTDERYFDIPRPKWYPSHLKRIIDIAFSSCFLVLLWPLFLIVAVIIKLTSRGPILFRQKRSGLNGKEFFMYKFRSMVSNAEQIKSELETFNMVRGPVFKMKRDPRVTGFGRLIRRTSIDELPQLWNVLRGEMSMVGPRPLPIYETEHFLPWQAERLGAKPGLTCLWQINGRSAISDFSTWVQLDLRYIYNRSLLLDLAILLKTVPVIISGFGAE